MIGSIAAQCASLANDYGATHGPNSPASFTVGLLIPDPVNFGALIEMPTTTTLIDEDTGAESTVANGYARATVANDGSTFPAPDPTTGELTSVPIEGFPAATAEYPDTATHWALYDATTGDMWDYAEFPQSERITIAEAGVTPRPVLSIFYNDLPGDFNG